MSDEPRAQSRSTIPESGRPMPRHQEDSETRLEVWRESVGEATVRDDRDEDEEMQC